MFCRIQEREAEGRIGALEEAWRSKCAEMTEVIKKKALESVDSRYAPLIEANDRAKVRSCSSF